MTPDELLTLQAERMAYDTGAPWIDCVAAIQAGKKLWFNPLTAEWELTS